ncbi:hypothetical protein MUK42_03440 [Musa troglodytarum]|uniref:Glycine-rich protein n=1 Tax=Musa troglodytarum TaxID=320322 RepID=A0A9E7HHE5_9LILI|nr:hypothetical protein MUK42_03440 [Musa troglodytarum]
MAAAWRGRDEAVDDFDEYDPTPYGGGYDLSLTFGSPLPPSEKTCYPISSGASGVDYERPHYSSGSVPSANEADYEDPYGRSRPKPQPAYGFRPQQEVEEGGVGDFGAYGGGRRPQPGPGYGDYGSEYGGRPKRDEEPSCGYEGCGSDEQPSSGFGRGHDQPKPYGEGEAGRYGYGSNHQGGGEYGSGGGRKYQTDEYGYGAQPTYERPVYGGEEETGRYSRPSRYDPDQGEGYRRPNYQGDDSDEEKNHNYGKHQHHRNYADDE